MSHENQTTETTDENQPQGEEGQEASTSETEPTVPETGPVSRGAYEAVLERMKAADRRATANEQRVAEMEAERDELRMRAAFDRAALTGDRRIHDLDAAWRLTEGHRATMTVNDDGTVEGVDGVVGHIMDRYPYLVADAPEPIDHVASVATSTPATKGTKPGSGVDVRKLHEKYPALRSASRTRTALYQRR